MQRACWLCVILLSLLASNSPAQEAPQDLADGVPELIEAVPQAFSLPADGTPVQPLSDYAWISAGAVDRMGLDVLFKGTADWIRQQIASAPETGGCVNLGTGISTPAPGWALSSFEEMALVSSTIFEGTVRGYRPGFYRQAPYPVFLLSIEIDSLVAHDETLPRPSGRVLAVYPGPGIFTMLDRPFCVQSRTFPMVPVPGDRVMVFSGRQPVDPSGEPLVLFNQNIVIERRGTRSIELPSRLQQDEALSKAQSLESVKLEVSRRRPVR